jgi:zinc transporter ZupT
MKILAITFLSIIVLWIIFATIVMIWGNLFKKPLREKLEEFTLSFLIGMVMVVFLCVILKSLILIL